MLLGFLGCSILVFSVFSEILAVFQVQEVDRKVEEIKAVISVYCSSKSVFRVPSYGQQQVCLLK